MLGDIHPLSECGWLNHRNFLACVRTDLSPVGWVSFPNVNNIEFNVVAILTVHCFQGASLTPEGRSRVGAENESDWFLASKTGKLHRPLAVEAFQFKIRRDFAFNCRTATIPTGSPAADSIGKLRKFGLVNHAVAVDVNVRESLSEPPGSFGMGDFSILILVVRLDPFEEISSARATIWLSVDCRRQDEKRHGKTGRAQCFGRDRHLNEECGRGYLRVRDRAFKN